MVTCVHADSRELVRQMTITKDYSVSLYFEMYFFIIRDDQYALYNEY